MSTDDVRNEIATVLRKCAAGRREYIRHLSRDKAMQEVVGLLDLQAETFESAARIAEGDTGPLYTMLPPYLWSDEMHAALFDKEPTAPAAATAGANHG